MKGFYIKIIELLYGGFIFLVSFLFEYLIKFEEYKKWIESYLFLIIYLKEVFFDIVIEVFIRINVGGKDLILFEIMVVKIFDYESNFDLFEKYNEFIDRFCLLNYEIIFDIIVF